MKKEVAIAVFLGLFLGLIVTFGIYTARRSNSTPTEQSAELLASGSPSATSSASASPSNSSLVLSAPIEGLITATKDIQVVGTTTPKALVFLFVGETILMEEADESGNFSTKISPPSGPSLLTVRAIDMQGATVEESRALFVGDPDATVEAPAATTSTKAR